MTNRVFDVTVFTFSCDRRAGAIPLEAVQKAKRHACRKKGR
jgi:hypothetical protein